MKKILRIAIITFISICGVAIVSFFAYRLLSQPTTQNSSEICVLIASDCPPFSSVVDDTLQGFEVDLVALLQTKIKQNLVLTPISSHILLKTLYDGDYQIAVGAITPTKPRLDYLEFSPGYYDATQTVLSLLSTDTIDSLGVIAKENIGVVTQTSSVLFIEDALIKPQILPINRLKKYPDLTAMIGDLQNSTIQYIVVEHTIATLLQANFALNIVYKSDNLEPLCLVYKKSATINKTINYSLNKVLTSQDFSDLITKYFLPPYNADTR